VSISLCETNVNQNNFLIYLKFVNAYDIVSRYTQIRVYVNVCCAVAMGEGGKSFHTFKATIFNAFLLYIYSLHCGVEQICKSLHTLFEFRKNFKLIAMSKNILMIFFLYISYLCIVLYLKRKHHYKWR
jgi:hypothetical protein